MKTFVSFVLLLLAVAALASEKCYYDPKGIDYSYFLKHTKFTKAEWNNDTKEARIALAGGEEVIIQYSACEQLGMTARYIMKRTGERINTEHLLTRLSWLGKNVLDGEDYALLEKSVESRNFRGEIERLASTDRVFLGVEGSSYQSFLVYVVNYKDDFYIEISWYM